MIYDAIDRFLSSRGLVGLVAVGLVACCVLSCAAAFLLRGDMLAASTLILGDENTVQVGADNDAGGAGESDGAVGLVTAGPRVQVLTIPLTPGNTLLLTAFCLCAFAGMIVFMILGLCLTG